MESPEKKRPIVKLYTDGACIYNPGASSAGGWSFILHHPASGRSKEASGGEHGTMNNRMEIMAVIQGLAALKGSSEVELFSDSQYVINAINDWIPKWKRFDWKKTKGKRQVKNADLWQQLDGLTQQHVMKANWVKGHAGHPQNERCDLLAETAAAKIATTPAPLVIEVQKDIDELFNHDAAGDGEDAE